MFVMTLVLLDVDFMISDVSFIIMFDLRHCVLLGVFTFILFHNGETQNNVIFDSPIGLLKLLI